MTSHVKNDIKENNIGILSKLVNIYGALIMIFGCSCCKTENNTLTKNASDLSVENKKLQHEIICLKQENVDKNNLIINLKQKQSKPSDDSNINKLRSNKPTNNKGIQDETTTKITTSHTKDATSVKTRSKKTKSKNVNKRVITSTLNNQNKILCKRCHNFVLKNNNTTNCGANITDIENDIDVKCEKSEVFYLKALARQKDDMIENQKLTINILKQQLDISNQLLINNQKSTIKKKKGKNSCINLSAKNYSQIVAGSAINKISNEVDICQQNDTFVNIGNGIQSDLANKNVCKICNRNYIGNEVKCQIGELPKNCCEKNNYTINDNAAKCFEDEFVDVNENVSQINIESPTNQYEIEIRCLKTIIQEKETMINDKCTIISDKEYTINLLTKQLNDKCNTSVNNTSIPCRNSKIINYNNNKNKKPEIASKAQPVRGTSERQLTKNINKHKSDCSSPKNQQNKNKTLVKAINKTIENENLLKSDSWKDKIKKSVNKTAIIGICKQTDRR